MENEELFRKDKKGLYYLDSRDVKISELYVKQMSGSYKDHAHFFKIDGFNDYIIKDSTLYPLFFNRSKNLKLLKELVEKQKEINNIDFPVAYYKSFNILKGIVIPYYPNSISLSEIIWLTPFEEFKNIYNHDSNEVDNLVLFLLEILELLHSMYKHGIIYIDVHSGNFLIYNNGVKVVDFEPGYVFVTNNKGWNYERMLSNYGLLVDRICKRFGFKNIPFHAGEDFSDTELRVKSLRKRLER